MATRRDESASDSAETRNRDSSDLERLLQVLTLHCWKMAKEKHHILAKLLLFEKDQEEK